MKFDQNNSTCSVFTGREGALSAIGHDLKLRVEKFDIDMSGTEVRASFDTKSLRVVGAVEGDVVDKGEISSRDKSKIESNIVKDVLKAKKFPTIEFHSDSVEVGDGAINASGTLTICGANKPFTAKVVKKSGEGWTLSATLKQTDFGMKPFKALLGQLRISDELRVELTLPNDIQG